MLIILHTTSNDTDALKFRDEVTANGAITTAEGTILTVDRINAQSDAQWIFSHL